MFEDLDGDEFQEEVLLGLFLFERWEITSLFCSLGRMNHEDHRQTGIVSTGLFLPPKDLV